MKTSRDIPRPLLRTDRQRELRTCLLEMFNADAVARARAECDKQASALVRWLELTGTQYRGALTDHVGEDYGVCDNAKHHNMIRIRDLCVAMLAEPVDCILVRCDGTTEVSQQRVDAIIDEVICDAIGVDAIIRIDANTFEITCNG